MKNTFLIGLTLILALFSCRKENDGIGLGTNDDTLNGIKSDTFTIRTAIKMPDSAWVSSNRSLQYVGGYNSDQTGLLSAKTFLTFTPNAITEAPSGSAVFDSLVIAIQPFQVVGQEDLELDIYSLNSAVLSQDYFMDDSIQTNSLIGNAILSDIDSSTTYTVKLDSVLGADLFADLTNAFASKSNFTSELPGIALISNQVFGTNTGALMSFEPIQMQIKLYYTDGGQTKIATANVATSSDAFGNINHNQSGSQVEVLLNDSALTNNEFMVQGLGGPSAVLYFPTIKSWYNSRDVIINKAELVCGISSTNNSFGPIDVLSIYSQGTASANGSIGEYDEVDESYTFNISALLRNRLENIDSAALHMGAVNPYFRPQVSVLYGPQNIPPMKLVLFYTEY